MERRELSEVISQLLQLGYSLDFNTLTERVERFEDIPANFVIDKIFVCTETFTSHKDIYVFAISSKIHHFKGILITGNISESVDFWNDLTHTLENLKSKLSQLLLTHEFSTERQ
jgi:hypothetical protein